MTTIPEAFVNDAIAALHAWSCTPEAGKLAAPAFGCPGDSYPAAAMGAANDICAKLTSITTPEVLGGVPVVGRLVRNKVLHEIENKLSQTQLSRVTINLSSFDELLIARFCEHVRKAVQRRLEYGSATAVDAGPLGMVVPGGKAVE